MAKSGEKSAENRPKRRAPLNVGPARHFVMGLGAAVIMFSGGVLLGGAAERYFEWLSALADPPPAFSALGSGALDRKGLAGEIGLTAQIDSPRAYFVTRDGEEAFMAPLYPPQSDKPSNPVSAVLLEPAGAPAEEDFANWVRGVGPVAVLVEFLGREIAPDEEMRARIAQALQKEGLRLSPDARFIDPHHRPRRRELAPPSFGMTFGGAVIGLGTLLGLVTLRSMRRERRRKARMQRREAARKAKEESKGQKQSVKAEASKTADATTSKPDDAGSKKSAASAGGEKAQAEASSQAGSQEKPQERPLEKPQEKPAEKPKEAEKPLKITGVGGD